jgi:hypothetical protein
LKMTYLGFERGRSALGEYKAHRFSDVTGATRKQASLRMKLGYVPRVMTFKHKQTGKRFHVVVEPEV